MARAIVTGAQYFDEIREDNGFYVDKTGFIKEWWEDRSKVTLITRPRRFGKTLAMSTVDYFFSVQHAKRSDLFEGLSIWEDEKYRKLQGTYPVIFISFANVKGTHYSDVRGFICRLFIDLFSEHEFLLDSSVLAEEDKKFFGRMNVGMEDADASLSLYQLSKYLYKYYGKRVIILLDEYDTPMQEAYLNGYWNEMSDFIGKFFNSAFKTNPYLERGLLTGITRVSKESIFSDLNNLKVVTTASRKYETSFGFTEEEVFSALEEFGLGKEIQKVREWYDGFRFGDCSSIYNPWSIINFLGERKISNYWVNTSSNALVSDLIQKGSTDLKMTMEDLLLGNSFSTLMDEEVVFDQLDSSEGAVWSLFLAGGYLKIAGDVEYDEEYGMNRYRLALTNMEVRQMFGKMVHGWFSDGRAEYNKFEKAMLAGDVREMNIFMNKIAVNTFSCFDTGKKPSEAAEPERFYHGFVLGLIVNLKKRYEITSNRESGYGRYDVMLSPKGSGQDGIILEFKVLDPADEESLQDTAGAAIRQIIEKEYASLLEAKGVSRRNIRIYGFAFSGKKVLIDGGCVLGYDTQAVCRSNC